MNASGSQAPLALKPFFIAAALWLPAAFFLWYLLRTVIVYPVIQGAGALLQWLLPDLIGGVEQEYEKMVLVTTLPAEGVAPDASGGVPVIAQDFEPLLYCYGIAVLVGLVMATPLDWRRTFMQLGLGYLIILPAQIFGLAGEVLRDLSYLMGDAAAAAVADAGLSQYAVALWYQFGYLVLPAVTPVVAWILFNRQFLEGLRRSVEEPHAGSGGQ
jgi:hypothetical protein